MPISRRNFVELCERLTVEDEKHFEDLWRHLGLSVDWTQNYQTIGTSPQGRLLLSCAISSAARPTRLRLLVCGRHLSRPQQAELESREYPASTTAHITGPRARCRGRCIRCAPLP